MVEVWFQTFSQIIGYLWIKGKNFNISRNLSYEIFTFCEGNNYNMYFYAVMQQFQHFIRLYNKQVGAINLYIKIISGTVDFYQERQNSVYANNPSI